MFDVRVIVAESKAAYVVNLDAYMHLCKRYHSKAEFMNEEEKEAYPRLCIRPMVAGGSHAGQGEAPQRAGCSSGLLSPGA